MPRALMRTRRWPTGGMLSKTSRDESAVQRSIMTEDLRLMVERDRVLLRQIQDEMRELVTKLDACQKVEMILLARIQRYV